MQTNLVVLLLFAGLGCTSERTESKRRDRDEETEQIQHLLEIVHPVMLSLCETRAAEREIEMISYELVKDHSTGLITIGNFQAEEFFPIASRADYLRLAGEIYSMRCPTPTPIDKRCSGIDQCVQQIKDCLNRNDHPRLSRVHDFTQARQRDYDFFRRRHVDSTTLERIRSLPPFVATDSSIISGVKLFTLVL
jgi:hypothetical protein